MKIIDKPLTEIRPYENNPRLNDGAVDAVAASIKAFGWKVPIVVDRDGVIVAGHTRYKAAKKLGMTSAPCIVADDLTPEQVRAFRVADNKTAELAEWDLDALAEELKAIDLAPLDINMEDFGFNDTDLAGSDEHSDEIEAEEKYSTKIDPVHYEPTMPEPPPLSICYNLDECNRRIAAAQSADIPEELRAFLTAAAYRHARFRYDYIAEYYAHASAEVQQLFEDSGLVVVDFQDAIKNGWVEMKAQLKAERDRVVGGADDEE